MKLPLIVEKGLLGGAGKPPVPPTVGADVRPNPETCARTSAAKKVIAIIIAEKTIALLPKKTEAGRAQIISCLRREVA